MKHIEMSVAMEAFIFHTKTSNRSDYTVIWYEKHFRAFKEYMLKVSEGKPVMVTDITPQNIREFINWLQTRKKYRKYKETEMLAASTVRGYMLMISSFFNWCYDEGMITKKPHDNIPYPKVPEVVRDIFSREEIKQLLKAVEAHRDDGLASRDKALVLVLLDTGVRASELCGMTLADVDANWQRILVRGKGMRERYVPISSTTRSALHRYVTFYRPPDHDNSNALFLSGHCAALRPTTLNEVLKYLAHYAQVKNVTPHRFRRTAATIFYEQSGGNLFRTQEFLGHAKSDTTRLYVRKSPENLELVHQTASPVANLLR